MIALKESIRISMTDNQNNYPISGNTIFIFAMVSLLTVFIAICIGFVQIFSVVNSSSEFNYKLGQLDQRVGIVEEENKRDLDLRANTYQRKIIERRTLDE